MNYYFYVIKSEIDGSLYKGITKDVFERVKQHNAGENLSTKSKKPYTLMYTEKLNNRMEARKREKYFKSGIGRQLLKELIH